MIITPMEPGDWPAVAAIFAEGIATGIASLETSVPPWEAWDAAHLRDCRLVARDGERVLAWAALSRVSMRQVYAGVAEVSIYVSARARGQGLGKRLLLAEIAASEAAGFWTLQAGILSENTISIALHAACGFRIVGVRQRLGQLHGIWRDIVLMERRSEVVGL